MSKSISGIPEAKMRNPDRHGTVQWSSAGGDAALQASEL